MVRVSASKEVDRDVAAYSEERMARDAVAEDGHLVPTSVSQTAVSMAAQRPKGSAEAWVIAPLVITSTGPARTVVSAKRFIAVSLSECEGSHTLIGQIILTSIANSSGFCFFCK